ncbi:hypothetical protein [Marinimicrobium sp. ABcell2]|uniref:hypothetical protein n=1 Tax=Marinimicrobium sp. ABcell2 TaxID=3069751 RepID=UPI0027B18740|nr:hypothetical protein [Marinimicrobium sp. ABcell2]MDQ2076744.1 hypothetical protein [Marinimicrobium sp. ABcell2]
MEEYIRIEEAARRLSVSPEFVRQMVAKGRLNSHGEDLLESGQVAELGSLMQRLRGGGIAAMVNATGDDKNPLD